MATLRELHAAARHLARLLAEQQSGIVFAESCTGGLISAALTRIPGISAYHCGSAVVYQLETKAAWLGISRKLLKNPGPVSPSVARAMAEGVLERTPQADLAASVTGHLGPDAPAGQDGLVYCAVTRRPAARGRRDFRTAVHRLQLDRPPRQSSPADLARLRIRRQTAAAEFVVSRVCDSLRGV